MDTRKEGGKEESSSDKAHFLDLGSRTSDRDGINGIGEATILMPLW